MRLKYYLRGLGIGMVVTALLMGFASKDNGGMTDEEIRARAEQLGMVEQVTLADIKNNTEGVSEKDDLGKPEESVPVSTKEPVAEQPSEAPVMGTEVPQVTQEPEKETSQIINATTPVPVSTKEPIVETEIPVQSDKTNDYSVIDTPSKDGEGTVAQTLPPTAEISGDTVLITIPIGNNSMNVSKVLEKIGLIESATSFDRYLRNNGYSKIINAGSYKITLGTSEAEIARIITNTN